ncbi:FAD-binding oxidoreductase [Nocardioides guangzhouensis]|uniref:FAD-binding oxidoreductase n=1 Tax=Nocardioides guangzhouensis TaxID=2497878 RepID=A0A4Q4ZAM1_9ACTN|nr:FAD-binding oxidoreductase [Nocardioides guangzhouensis]RYP84942.1 FAD-binding oxidoreductase [Nocardioides guangzhouensis]
MSERRLLTGWGGTAPTAASTVSVAAADLPRVVTGSGGRGVIARGLGRSYGDAAQNAGGTVVLPLPGWYELDAGRGTVRVSAGTSFHDLMRELIPRGFFVPVTPGTRYVTVGGAIAADVHGKNHHRVGALGGQVVELELLGADGTVRTVGPGRDLDLFWATVGGMGLTGVITSAVLRLLPVETGQMVVDTERLDDLDAVLTRMAESDDAFTYSVAWIDTLARGRSMGRSVLTRGEHARREDLAGSPRHRADVVPHDARVAMPSLLPPHLISRPTTLAFNEMWFRKAPRRREGQVQTVAAFFHPLDGVRHWNRVYGRGGFLQYQFVVPENEDEALRRILGRISRAGYPSFLAVLKRFGPGDPGPLSFPMAGWTLAIDLPTSPTLRGFLADLDGLVVASGGRVYLAKDSRMEPGLLAEMYPRLDEFRAVRARVDPGGVFQSDLSRRLHL